MSWRLLRQRFTLSAASAGLSYCYICVRILLYTCVLILRYIYVLILTAHTVCGFRSVRKKKSTANNMCPHTPVYMCPHPSLQYMCPHTVVYMCPHSTVSSVRNARTANDFACYICVYMCPRPHTTVHVSCRQCSQGRADDYGPSGLLFQLRDGPCASTG